MTFVVTESCIRCRYTDCVDVCPVDCFHEGPNFLTIDPDECIDCAVCVAECPVNAIFAEEDVPADQQQFIKLNAELTVLSACQTGLGKFSKGEGVIGLSRALVYAGSKNIIVSFWSVADEGSVRMKGL